MVVTVIVVFDSLGYWRICRPVIALRPISRISRLTTSASTGRRMKMSVKDTSQFRVRVAGGFGAVEDRYVVAPPCSGFYRGAHRLEDRVPLGVLAVLADHVNTVAVERIVDGGLRQPHHVG